MYLYDIHTHHLDDVATSDFDIIRIVNIDPSNSEDKEKYPFCNYTSCGIHPWNAHLFDLYSPLLNDLLQNGKVVALGEIGLDKLRGPDMEVQLKVFRAQIELAISLHKPMIIHCVKAFDHLIALHNEYKTDIAWILHGFRGGVEQTRQLVKQGFLFSIGDKFNQDALCHIPIESIFCETDVSEISICKVYDVVSTTLGVSRDHFISEIDKNVKKINLIG